MDYGILILIPILVVLILALWTKSTFISILGGVVVAYLMLANFNPLDGFWQLIDGFYVTATDDGTVWVLLVVALFGALIALMQDSAGVLGFSNLTQKILKSRRSSLLGTWILGIIIFVDDYLNCLAVGAAVRDLTDKYKVPREMLAYIVNSTGVTVCAIIPFSTWGAFMGTQMEEAGMTGELSAVGAYFQAMPFVVYGWLAVLAVPLVILGIIPLFGPMKKANERTLTTGEVLSPESKAALVELPEEEAALEGKKRRAINFLAPILLVAIITVVTEDMVVGLFAALVLCLIMYLPQKLMTFNQYINSIMRGLTDMFPLIIIILLAYMFVDANTALGLIDMITENASNALNPALLPALIFVVIGLLSFGSGSFWGLAAIAFPIVGPLAAALGVPYALASGALISAVCFGGHICIYSDTVILTAASTQVTNVDYFKTSAPLVAIPFVASIIVFLILGFVII
ncbi:MAG: Na+/H+ antiporter NhaC family protein [Anaerovoracaceae bacterium]